MKEDTDFFPSNAILNCHRKEFKGVETYCSITIANKRLPLLLAEPNHSTGICS